MGLNELTLRPVLDSDIGLLTSWLNKDHVKKWYHDTEDWLMELHQRHNTFSWISHFIVMEGNKAIGLCQYYGCFDADSMEDWYTVPQPGDTFSIDYLIGDEEYLGKGYGKAIVGLLTNTIKQKEKAKRIIIQPEPENHASNQVLLANGYLFKQDNHYYCKALNES